MVGPRRDALLDGATPPSAMPVWPGVVAATDDRRGAGLVAEPADGHAVAVVHEEAGRGDVDERLQLRLDQRRGCHPLPVPGSAAHDLPQVGEQGVPL